MKISLELNKQHLVSRDCLMFNNLRCFICTNDELKTQQTIY